jgi:hypothetical protein
LYSIENSEEPFFLLGGGDAGRERPVETGGSRKFRCDCPGKAFKRITLSESHVQLMD